MELLCAFAALVDALLLVCCCFFLVVNMVGVVVSKCSCYVICLPLIERLLYFFSEFSFGNLGMKVCVCALGTWKRPPTIFFFWRAHHHLFSFW